VPIGNPDSTQPRIAPTDPPYPAEVQAEFDKLMRGAPPLALFRTVARNPRVLQRMMAGSLLDRGSISLRSRELMILRVCARCGAEYEWGVHVATFLPRHSGLLPNCTRRCTAVAAMRAGALKTGG
jgi:alkylhydroperoxidase/carboxymuconolactone decarboxylase family protein YurZ